MGRTATVASLLTQLRRLGDWLDAASEAAGSYDGTYMTDETLIGFLDSSYRLAYEELADCGEGWNPSRTTLTASNGAYAYPTDLYRLSAVEASVASSDGGTGWVPIPRATPDDDYGPWSGASVPCAYRDMGDSLELLPTSGSFTVRVTYVPQAASLTGSGDTIVAEAGLDHLTVLGAVRLGKIREEKPYGDVQALYDERMARTVRALRNRDRASVVRMRPRSEARRWPTRRY